MGLGFRDHPVAYSEACQTFKMEFFLRKNLTKADNYFHKKFQQGCLTGFRICLSSLKLKFKKG